jgi:hypothetical protein
MAIDALAIPFDITWQRLGYMADMVERGFADATMPPKWRSSATIYAYVVPESETAEDYPDHRILYLKVSASITGWSPREALPSYLKIRDDEPWSPEGNEGDSGGGGSGDPVQDDAQSTISGSGALVRNYWPCVAAIAQVAVYPRPETGVADDDYPYIADFEPKKRELYEAVTATNEVLSGSQHNTNVRKGSTTTVSNEVTAGAEVGLPVIGSTSITGTRRWGSEDVNITTTDASTERRETAGRSTQLSQMYQLFNGYHCGTNRAVFVVFPRPHIVSESAQIENSLIAGDRRLEGVQDLFLIVQVPKTNPGFCVRVLLDLSHKTEGHAAGRLPYTTTRRRVSGCATFAADRLVSVPSPPLPPKVPRVEVIDEGEIGGARGADREQMKTGRPARIGYADDYNLANAQLQRTLLGTAASSGYRPRPFEETSTFYYLAKQELVRSSVTLVEIEKYGYLLSGELAALTAAKVGSLGDLFLDPKDKVSLPKVVGEVRARIWASIVAKTKTA